MSGNTCALRHNISIGVKCSKFHTTIGVRLYNFHYTNKFYSFVYTCSLESHLSRGAYYHGLLGNTKSFADFYYDNPKHYNMQQKQLVHILYCY